MKRCELCELPLSQCAHGGERKAKKQRGSGSSANGSPSAKGRRRSTASAPAKQVKRGSRICVFCKTKRRYSRYNRCIDCAIKAGFRLCAQCGRYYEPTKSTGRKGRCPACRRSGKSGSVWAPPTAGSPGLGKRR